MKDLKLDVLENAEDEIINDMETFSSDSESVRKRVFSMSEKKYNDMVNNKNNTNNNIEVSGVEKYRRPVWYKPLCAAAAVAVILGGGGTAFMMNRSGNSIPDDSSSDSSNVQQVTEEVTAEAVTAEPVTDAVSENVPTEDEMRALFEEYAPVYFDAYTFGFAESTDRESEPITYWGCLGAGDIFDVPDEDAEDYMSEDGKVYFREKFYKMNDPRFSTINDMKEYYGRYFLFPDREIYFNDKASDYQPGDKLPEDVSFGIVEYNGALYTSRKARPEYSVDISKNILCDKPYNVTDKSFTWVRTVKVDQGTNVNADFGDLAYNLELRMEKDADGQWKLNNLYQNYDIYDETVDYTTAYDEECMKFPFIPLNSGIDFVKAHDAALCFLEDYYPENIYGDSCWQLVSELPDDSKIIVDNFENDNNWLEFSYMDDEVGSIALYVDKDNRVIATVEK